VFMGGPVRRAEGTVSVNIRGLRPPSVEEGTGVRRTD
jgi:hypothetical protein